MSLIMTTNKKQKNKLIKDMGAIFTPVFYIFGFVAIASAIIVCGFGWSTILTAIFLIVLAACAAADINKGIVPDMLAILIAVLAIVRILTNEFTIQNFINYIGGAAVLSVPMLVVALIIKNGFGGGDIKMMAAAGLFLGLENTIIAGFISFLIAGSYGLFILFTKKGETKSKIRLAPFLAVGCAFAELFGDVFLAIFRTIL